MKQKFVHLHTHSTYSMKDGLGYPKDILAKAEEMEFRSLAITDHGNMNMVANFYLSSQDYDVKPIYGCEFYLVEDLDEWQEYKDSMEEKTKTKKLSREKAKKHQKRLRHRFHIVLLAKNEEGLKNLYELTYHACKKGFYYRPRIDIKMLEQYNEGIICLSACIGGYINQNLEDGEIINRFKNIFGKNLFLELMLNEMEEQHELNKKIIKYGKKYKIKIVYTNDNHYIEKEHSKTHQTLLNLQYKQTVKAKQKVRQFDCKELYLKSYDDVLRSYKKFGYKFGIDKLKEYLANTLIVDKMIENIEFDTKSVYTIKFKNAFEVLKKQCFKALKLRISEENYSKYKVQLKKELEVIEDKGFSNYFLLLGKLIRHSKTEQLVGAGRGSAAGSLISYLLEITDIDPLRFGLFFERFLNKSRKEFPDIDTDFQYPDMAKQFLRETYGEDNVASISTFGTFQIKGLLRDLFRIYDIMEISVLNKYLKEIDKEIIILQNAAVNKGISTIGYDAIYKVSDSFRKLMGIDEDLNRDMKVLLNQIRHMSRHAAGVVVCRGLRSKLPLQLVKGELQAPFVEGASRHELSKMGFLKLDILGLKTLSVIDDTLKLAKIDYGEVHPDNLDLEDKKIFRFIYNKKNLAGIFQFDTRSMKDIIKGGKIECFDDLIALNALNRPGPIKSGMHLKFFDYKEGKNEDPIHPLAETVLASTYGLMLYQEQLMQVANKLAGFNLDETDTLRRNIIKVSQENKEESKEEREKLEKVFIRGCKKNEVSKEEAKDVWKMFLNFVSYGFNKSHSCSYAMIGYQEAYLKTNYLKEFYTALLMHEDFKDYGAIINEAVKNDISIKSVNIKTSEIDFTLKDDKIYWALSRIKGIGDKAAQEIVEARKRKPIEGFKGFLVRNDIKWRLVSKRAMDPLIKVGAFDYYDENRKRLLEVYTYWMDNWKRGFTKKQNDDRKAKFKKLKAIEAEYEDTKDFTSIEKSKMELELVGINLQFSPFTIGNRKKKIKRILEEGRAGAFSDGEDIPYLVTPISIKEKKDKRQKLMGFITLLDIYGESQSGIIFSSNYKSNKMEFGQVYFVKGKVSDNSFIINKVWNLEKQEEDKDDFEEEDE